MNKQDRNLVRIVGMSQVNAGRKPRGIGSEKRSGSATGQFSGVRIEYGQSGSVVGGNRMLTVDRSDDARIQRIIEFQERQLPWSVLFHRG
jgi:hypothetical protein